MPDFKIRQNKRHGTLAQQLADEVRAERPWVARVRAYCGCEAARSVFSSRLRNSGHDYDPENGCQTVPDWSGGGGMPEPAHEPGDLCVHRDGIECWTTGLHRLASDLPARVTKVKCPECPGDGFRIATVTRPVICETCQGTGTRLIETDMAQWLGAWVAWRVASAALGCTPGADCSLDIPHGISDAHRALDAAKAWLDEPTEANWRNWWEVCAQGGLPTWVVRPTVIRHSDSPDRILGTSAKKAILAAAQLLPNVREIACAAVLEVL